MTLPNDPDVGEVADEHDLSLLDEKILTVLRASDAPVLTSAEVTEEGIRKSRRTVHDHLEDLEKLELVQHKRAGEGDRTPKVWWFNESVIASDENEPPGEKTVLEGLEAMTPASRRSLRTEFPEFEGKRPPLFRWSVGLCLGSLGLAFLVLTIQMVQFSTEFAFIPDLTDWLFVALLGTLAGVAGVVIYAIGYIQSRVTNQSEFGDTIPRLLEFYKYAFGFGVFLAVVGIYIESVTWFDTLAGWLFGAGAAIVLLAPPIFLIFGIVEIASNRQRYLTPFSSS